MKFMMLILHDESLRDLDIPPALNAAMGEFVQRSFASGVLKETNGLLPTRDGKRIRLRKGKLTHSDGPFTETKEVVGGYAMVETKTYEEAIRVATEFMELHRTHWPAFEGTAEIRPIHEYAP
jgi:hypothetical protein